MDISINAYSNGLTFNSRKLTKALRAQRNEILESLLLKSDITLKEMKNASGLTYNAINDWFIETKGITSRQFFKNKRDEVLKQELAEFHAKKTPLPKIAAFYGRSVRWVHDYMLNFGIIKPKHVIDKELDNSMMSIIHNGGTIRTAASQNNCSNSRVIKWLKNNLPEGIVEYRHKNNIRLHHEQDEKLIKIKKLLEQLFSEGKTITEAAKILELTTENICRLRDLFGLKTKKELAIERMKEMVPDFIKAKMRIPEMAKQIGEISTATIRRYIKSLTGKNYIEIRLEK